MLKINKYKEMFQKAGNTKHNTEGVKKQKQP